MPAGRAKPGRGGQDAREVREVSVAFLVVSPPHYILMRRGSEDTFWRKLRDLQRLRNRTYCLNTLLFV